MTMKKITVYFKENGYLLVIDGAIKNSGEYVYKATEEFQLVERIGELLTGRKMEAKERGLETSLRATIEQLKDEIVGCGNHRGDK